ncbi:hypothetical protein DSO57_1028236 [Entomophthora muscae]|uniref:Uncharacterized protein n=1 Tax=Entomophthora muscae TaxID=34485 RepID=A0ACC2TDS3_9FUNG|nr:hypothetical protein DSO57_1028236 [Entomophthora muscae]
MYPTRYTNPAGHPCCGPVSALRGNGSLPNFYFGEDVLSFLDKVETFTVGYTEEQKIKYLLGSLCQNSFDTILPFLGLVYSYWYLKSVIRHELFYPQIHSNPRRREDYENSFLNSCNHQTDILKTSQAASCPTLPSLSEDNSGSFQSGGEITLLPEGQETRISTDGLDKQCIKLVNPMKVISLSSLFTDQYSLECLWDPDKLSEIIYDAVQAFDPNKIVDSNAKVNHKEKSKDLDYQEVFGIAGPLTAKAMGTYLPLPLQFGKLIVTAPAIVLDNHSYDNLLA